MRITVFVLLLTLMTVPGWAEEKVPDSIVLGGHKFTLETYMWRDFMPISPPGGKPLIATVTLASKGHEMEAPKVTWEALELWQDGKCVWKTELQSEGRRGSARGGPKLDPGSLVTAVVGFCDASGKQYRLKAENQLIHRTD